MPIWTWEGSNNNTDESEDDSEESDDGSQNLARNELIGNTVWSKCSQCKAENREMDCLCCQEVAALNKKFDKSAVKCTAKSEEFQTLCVNKAVLENVSNWALWFERWSSRKGKYESMIPLCSL